MLDVDVAIIVPRMLQQYRWNLLVSALRFSNLNSNFATICSNILGIDVAMCLQTLNFYRNTVGNVWYRCCEFSATFIVLQQYRWKRYVSMLLVSGLIHICAAMPLSILCIDVASFLRNS